jgi:DNA-directed RNA polymerase specialized sigma24 family protein
MENQEEIIQKCLTVDNKAFEKLINNIQNRIYTLSIRFYWDPMDAEDATQ